MYAFSSSIASQMASPTIAAAWGHAEYGYVLGKDPGSANFRVARVYNRSDQNAIDSLYTAVSSFGSFVEARDLAMFNAPEPGAWLGLGIGLVAVPKRRRARAKTV